jgi:hypothetical protein
MVFFSCLVLPEPLQPGGGSLQPAHDRQHLPRGAHPAKQPRRQDKAAEGKRDKAGNSGIHGLTVARFGGNLEKKMIGVME